MTEPDRIAGLARAEVVERTFALTRQYLALHTVVVGDDGIAAIARIDETSEAGAYHVYFPLLGVPYHCVVVIRPDDDGDLAVSWVYIQPATRVYLAIRSNDITPGEVTRRIGLQPTRTVEKGSPIAQRQNAPPSPRHHWALDVMPGVPGDLDEKVGILVAVLEPVAHSVAALKPSCDVRLTIVYEGWIGNSCLGGIQLDAKATRVLAEAGGWVDIDLYASGPRLRHDHDTPDA